MTPHPDFIQDPGKPVCHGDYAHLPIATRSVWEMCGACVNAHQWDEGDICILAGKLRNISPDFLKTIDPRTCGCKFWEPE